VYIHNHWIRYQWEALQLLVGRLGEVPRAEVWPNPPEDDSPPSEPSPIEYETVTDGGIILPPSPPILPGHFDLTGRLGGILPALPESKQPTPSKTRKPATVTTLCVHQMAVKFGVTGGRVRYWTKMIAKLEQLVQDLYQFQELQVRESPEAAEAFARRIALHERMCRIPYHYAALLNGDRLKINPPTQYTYHGNGANKRSLGLAVEGLYPGLESSRKKKHHDLDDFMIETVRGLFRLAIMEAKAAGMPVTKVTAHRVFSGGRTGDPGEAIWEEIVLWAITEFEIGRAHV